MKLSKAYSEKEIIQGCKSGDRKMQELLYQQTAAKMLAVCMRYARDRMEAEDVLQMAYIKIFEKIKDFRNEGSFDGWMRRIFINSAIESYRKNLKFSTTHSLEQLHENVLVHVDFQRLEMKDLMSLVQQLADGYRIVFNMYAIEGYSHREIAEILSISEGASKSQLSRARAILKQKILKMEELNYETHFG